MLVTAAILTVGAVGTAASAAPGDLDPTFGSGGVATVSPTLPPGYPVGDLYPGRGVTAIAVDPAGNVLIGSYLTSEDSSGDVVTTDVVVVRLTSAGTPDPTFGESGVALTTVPNFDQVIGMALQPSGSILVGLTSSILRLSPDGAIDQSFGADGTATVAGPVHALGVDAAGDILLGGQGTVERLTPSGTPDPSFGDQGIAAVGGSRSISAVATATDGTVVVGAYPPTNPLPDTPPLPMMIYRLSAEGAPVGAIAVGTSGFASVTSLVPGRDGSVFAVGELGQEALIAKLTAADALDLSFGNAGLVAVPNAGQITTATGAALLPTGSLEVGGALQPNGTGAGVLPELCGIVAGQPIAWVARLDPDGSPDRTVTPTGLATITPPDGPNEGITVGPVISSQSPVLAGDTFSDNWTLEPTAIRLQGGAQTAPPPPVTATRLAGPDRVGTAIAVSQATFAAATATTGLHARAVVIADADSFADALVGIPFAAELPAPLLITPGASLDPRDPVEIRRVLGNPDAGGEVFVLGGSAAITDDVATQIEALGYTVHRIAGADRYATSVQVAEETVPGGPGGLTCPPGSPRVIQVSGMSQFVFEANGNDFPDALAAGAAAASVGGVVVLTNGATLPSEVQQFASQAMVRMAVGGPAADADPTAVPIVGANRYDTAAKVAAAIFPTPSGVGIASGVNFPDALAGGVRAAVLDEPILLTNPDSLSPSTSEFLTATGGWIDTADVFGGSAAISDQTLVSIQQAIP